MAQQNNKLTTAQKPTKHHYLCQDIPVWEEITENAQSLVIGGENPPWCKYKPRFTWKWIPQCNEKNG